MVLPEDSATATSRKIQYHLDSRRVYSLEDVEVLNLVCHATWVFDIINKKFWFGNVAALEFWKAQTLESFVNRSFDDMSETTMKKNLDILERLKRNEKWAESVSSTALMGVCMFWDGMVVYSLYGLVDSQKDHLWEQR